MAVPLGLYPVVRFLGPIVILVLIFCGICILFPVMAMLIEVLKKSCLEISHFKYPHQHFLFFVTLIIAVLCFFATKLECVIRVGYVQVL